MSAHSHHGHEELHPGEIPPAQTKGIWRVFIILCVLTAVEFAFAFLMDAGSIRNAIFIILTIVKAFFIVGEFMHLKHETKSLIWCVLVPMALLVWLLVVLVAEGTYFFDSITNYISNF